MIGIIDDIWKHAPDRNALRQDPHAQLRGLRRPAPGLARACTGSPATASISIGPCAWAITSCSAPTIPTRDLKQLRLSDHGCEVINGLTRALRGRRLRAAREEAGLRAADARDVRPHPRKGRNQDGLLYVWFNPQDRRAQHGPLRHLGLRLRRLLHDLAARQDRGLPRRRPQGPGQSARANTSAPAGRTRAPTASPTPSKAPSTSSTASRSPRPPIGSTARSA